MQWDVIGLVSAGLTGLLSLLDQAARILAGNVEVKMAELLAANAIGATFGVLAIQTYAEVILKHREELKMKRVSEHTRSIRRLEHLVGVLVIVAIICALSTVFAFYDQTVPAQQVLGQNVDQMPLTAFMLAKIQSQIAATLALYGLLSYAFREYALRRLIE